MRRSAPLLFAMLLAATTGVAGLGVGLTFAPPLPVEAPAAGRMATANADLVRRFYHELNATLRTGDPAPLSELVASDFVDRAALLGFGESRTDLVRSLLALRAIFPTFWFTVNDAFAQDDWVVAQVRVAGVARGTFLGVPLSGGPEGWDEHVFFRIAQGRIVERWSAGSWPVLPAPLAEAPYRRPPAAALVRLARINYWPGAHQQQPGPLGPVLIAVESGTLMARVEGEAVLTSVSAIDAEGSRAATTRPGTEVTLGIGDGLLIPSGKRYELWNSTVTPTVVFAVALLPWASGAAEGTLYRWPDVSSPDVTAQILADGIADPLPPGPVTIGLGRLTLGPQEGLDPQIALGPQLVFIETGTLDLAEDIDHPSAHLSAGATAIIQHGTLASFQNPSTDSVGLVMVTISPATAVPTPCDPTDSTCRRADLPATPVPSG